MDLCFGSTVPVGDDGCLGVVASKVFYLPHNMRKRTRVAFVYHFPDPDDPQGFFMRHLEAEARVRFKEVDIGYLRVDGRTRRVMSFAYVVDGVMNPEDMLHAVHDQLFEAIEKADTCAREEYLQGEPEVGLPPLRRRR